MPPASEAAQRPASYPPPQHFLRDLDVATEIVASDRVVATAEVPDTVRDAAGAAALGFVSAVVDLACANVALLAGHPNWTATADLSLSSSGWLTDGPMRADCRLLRVGSHTVVVAAEVFDGGLARTGSALLAFARIPRSASASARDVSPEDLIGTTRRSGPGTPSDVPLVDRLGVKVVDAETGAVEVAKSDYAINSFGTINGGVLGVLFSAAAEAAVPGMVARDIQIHYLRQAGAGPARTATTVLRRAADHAVCTIEAVDVGEGGRLLSVATVTLQPPPT